MDSPPPQGVTAHLELLALPRDLLDDILLRAAVGATWRETAALLSICTRFRDSLRSATNFRPTSARAHDAAGLRQLRLRDCQALSRLTLQLRASSTQTPTLLGGVSEASSGTELVRELPQLLRLERLKIPSSMGGWQPCDMAPVTALTRLSSMCLGFPFFAGMASLWPAMSALRKLRIEPTFAPIDLAPLQQLPQLQSLTVGVSPGAVVPAALLVNFSCISALTALESLSLLTTEPDLRWCQHLAPLSRLLRLKVRSTAARSNAPANRDVIAGARLLAALTTLREVGALSMFWCADAIAHVASLPALERLNLSSAWGLTAAALAPMSRATALRHLALRLCALEDTAVACVARCSRLTSLDLAYNPKLTPAAAANLTPLAQGLQRLSLRECTFVAASEPAVAALSALTALTHLDADSLKAALASVLALPVRSALRTLGVKFGSAQDLDPFAGTDQPCFPALRHLQLQLPQRKVGERSGDGDISLLGTLPHLQTLELSRGCLTEGELRWLVRGAPRLQSLTLLASPEGGLEAFFAQLQLLPALRQVILPNQSLSGAFIAAAGALQQLRTLALLGWAGHETSDACVRELQSLCDLTDLRVVTASNVFDYFSVEVFQLMAAKGIEHVIEDGFDYLASAPFRLE